MFLEKIGEICSKYEDIDYYSGDKIPLEKIFDARKLLKISYSDEIYALSADFTIVMCSSGMYSKYTDQEVRISWDELKDLTIIDSKDKFFAKYIVLSNGIKIDAIGAALSVDKTLVPLINEIITELKINSEQQHLAGAEKYCCNCGNDLEQLNRFCPNCGTLNKQTDEKEKLGAQKDRDKPRTRKDKDYEKHAKALYEEHTYPYIQTSNLAKASSEVLVKMGNNAIKPIVNAFIGNISSSDEVDIDARNDNGNTALMLLAERGLDNLVELFINHGADVNAKNKDGTTALMMAASFSHRDTMELLLKHGADVDAADKDGNRAEQYAYSFFVYNSMPFTRDHEAAYENSGIPWLLNEHRLIRENELIKQKWDKLENEQKLSSGVKAAREYLARVKKDHQLRMRVQKCINNEEYLQLARSEGYIFTEDELNEAKEWQKVFEE